MNEAGRQGTLFIVSGPSGVGKSTLVQRLLQLEPDLAFSVSCTTRPRRPGEVDGRHYRFVDRQAFSRMIERDEFLESAEYNGHWYGTPRAPVVDWLTQGRGVILEIEVQGAQQVRARRDSLGFPMCFIFILPPSVDALRERIRGRGTEDNEKRRRRLCIAEGELRQAEAFDVRIVNAEVESALEALRQTVRRAIGRS